MGPRPIEVTKKKSRRIYLFVIYLWWALVQYEWWGKKLKILPICNLFVVVTAHFDGWAMRIFALCDPFLVSSLTSSFTKFPRLIFGEICTLHVGMIEYSKGNRTVWNIEFECINHPQYLMDGCTHHQSWPFNWWVTPLDARQGPNNFICLLLSVELVGT